MNDKIVLDIHEKGCEVSWFQNGEVVQLDSVTKILGIIAALTRTASHLSSMIIDDTIVRAIKNAEAKQKSSKRKTSKTKTQMPS